MTIMTARPSEDRTAKWLVGGRLSAVLHVGDTALAYQLAEQGHEVTVVDPHTAKRRHPEVAHVRVEGDRLPFVSDVFDVVVAPELRDSPSALGEYARVLLPGGLLSTVRRSYDDSIPWLRRLRELVGHREPPAPPVDTFTASELFDDPETSDVGSWQKLDLAGLLAFAREEGGPGVDETTLVRVRALFAEYAGQTGFLRLRHQTTCVRARVRKEALPQEAEPPDTLLLDFR